MGKDYYVILGAARNASKEQIRVRFRQLARERHPDRFQGVERQKAELDFQEITEAFNVLLDATRRRQHDLELARPEAQSAAWKQLDVSVLQYAALNDVFGVDDAALAAGGAVTYTQDPREAVVAVAEGRANAAFLLNATPVDQVLAVAVQGDRADRLFL